MVSHPKQAFLNNDRGNKTSIEQEYYFCEICDYSVEKTQRVCKKCGAILIWYTDLGVNSKLTIKQNDK